MFWAIGLALGELIGVEVAGCGEQFVHLDDLVL